MKKINFSEKVGSELLHPTFDLSIDYGEIFIDDLIENETIKEIPFVKSIVGVVKTGIPISKSFFVKKTTDIHSRVQQTDY